MKIEFSTPPDGENFGTLTVGDLFFFGKQDIVYIKISNRTDGGPNAYNITGNAVKTFDYDCRVVFAEGILTITT